MFLVVGKGMFGTAVARHLARRAPVTLVGTQAAPDGSHAFGAHHDEGRIIGILSRDRLWQELVTSSLPAIGRLSPDVVVPCGVVHAVTARAAEYRVAARDLQGRKPGAISELTVRQARSLFPALRFTAAETLWYEPGGGYFSPRRYVRLAAEDARRHGARIRNATVTGLHTTDDGATVTLDSGGQHTAKTVVLALGAFAAGSPLLPKPLALRAKSEIYALAEVAQGQEPLPMPCIVRDTGHPDLDDLYVLPPIRYPDGRTYVKVGANTRTDRWLPTPDAVRAWYRDGDPAIDTAAVLAAFREALTELLPTTEFRSWHLRRCADAYTARGHPYIDAAVPGRLVVVLGGNGRGAQAADAVGRLAADLALTGSLPEPHRHADHRALTESTEWTGMRLMGTS